MPNSIKYNKCVSRRCTWDLRANPDVWVFTTLGTQPFRKWVFLLLYQFTSTVWRGWSLVSYIVCCALNLCVLCQLFSWYSYISWVFHTLQWLGGCRDSTCEAGWKWTHWNHISVVLFLFTARWILWLFQSDLSLVLQSGILGVSWCWQTVLLRFCMANALVYLCRSLVLRFQWFSTCDRSNKTLWMYSSLLSSFVSLWILIRWRFSRNCRQFKPARCVPCKI